MNTFWKLSLYSSKCTALNCVKRCLHTAAHFTVTLSTGSSLISLSLCLYAFLCVELAKQAPRLKPFIFAFSSCCHGNHVWLAENRLQSLSSSQPGRFRAWTHSYGQMKTCDMETPGQPQTVRSVREAWGTWWVTILFSFNSGQQH